MSDSARCPASDAEWSAFMRQRQPQLKVEPQPFFYARVRARLSAKAGPADALLPGWLWRPAYAAVLAALVLAASGDEAVAATARTGPRSSWPMQQLPR